MPPTATADPAAATGAGAAAGAEGSSRAPLHVAIVGSGVSGLSAAWLLNQYPAQFKVTLYEAADYLGGHTHTVQLPPLPAHADKQSVPVDTGFIVMNPCTYPNFLRFLDQLQVPLTASDMSFAVSRDKGAFEWAGDTLATVFAQRKNLTDLTRHGMWCMLWDVLRFHWHAADIADAADQVTFNSEGATDAARALYAKHKNMSIGQYLIEGNYSPSFKDNFLVPQTAAIWSTPSGTCLEEFPILTLISFFRNHRMLQLVGRPKWLTVALGSHEYVKRIAAELPDVRLSCGAAAITRTAAASATDRPRVRVTDTQGGTATYDHVILATHGDTSARLVKDLSDRERQVLGLVKYTPNRAVLHRDANLMPRTRAAWSSWNFITRTGDQADDSDAAVCVTYWMNRLQPFIPTDTHGDVFLTINPLYEPDPALVIDEYAYDHPVYGFDLVQAQEQIQDIANMNGLGFAGAWLNYCFHEDGCTSGLLAAAALGASPPFPLTLNGGYPTHRRAYDPLPGAPLVPSRDIYHATMARVLPHAYLDMNADAKVAAQSKTLPRAVDHAKAMSFTEVAVGLASMAAHALLRTLRVVRGPAKRVVQTESRATVPVLALEPRDAIGLSAPVRMLELAERWFVGGAFLAIGTPLVAVLWLLGMVEIVDGLAGAGKHQQRELVWVAPSVRVVWK